MKATDFNKKVDQLIAAVSGDELLDIVERVGLNTKAEINKRIINTGTSADGSQLKPYSAPYLQFKQDVGRFRGHVDYSLGNYSINKRIEAVENRKKTKNATLRQFQELGGVKQSKKFKGKSKADLAELKAKRRAKALPQGPTLWNSIGVVEKKGDNGKLIVSIAARDPLNIEKLKGLAFGNGKGTWKGRGDVLAASQQEQQNANAKFTQDFGQLVRQIFGQ